MALEETDIVTLRDDFYRDSFGKVVLMMLSFVVAMSVLVALSLYFYLEKPRPTVFPVNKEMRILSPVPLDQPYLSTPALLQWVADVLNQAFVLDFNNYQKQLKATSAFFTAQGWQAFLNQLNIYVNYNNVRANKLFVTSTPLSAPYILREGLIPESNRYGWWVQMPLTVRFDGYKPLPNKVLVLQVLVVRVSTLNNLNGIAIENVVQAAEAAGAAGAAGATGTA
jgi:intracellular multiplication protein IcmL